MDRTEDNRLRETRQTFDLSGAADQAGLSPAKTKYYRAKVFKSGNSLALRLPAGLRLEAGMEMDLRTEADGSYSIRQPDAPKRKFNIDKVWGSATSLKPIDPDDRWFEERTLDWGKPADDGQA